MAEEQSFGWGIMGTGAIAGLFAADLRLLPQARLAAVQSRSREKAEGFAARCGAARVYDDEDAFLALAQAGRGAGAAPRGAPTWSSSQRARSRRERMPTRSSPSSTGS